MVPCQRQAMCCELPEEDAEADTDLEQDEEEATVYKRKKGGYRPYKPADNRDQLLC